MITFGKKERLFAPMLSTFGGGSIRGFNAGGGAGDPDWFVNHGTGAPTWSTSATNYTISSINGHYGMGLDQFGRYIVVWTRGYSTGGPPYYCIMIPITDYGLDTSAAINVYFPAGIEPGNSFGGFVDTKNNYFWHQQFGETANTRWSITGSALGNATTANPAGDFPSTGQNITADGTNDDGEDANDAGFLDYLNGKVLYGGRSSTTLYSRTYNFNTGSTTWTNETTTTLSSNNSFNGMYSISRDYSSGYYVSCQRTADVFVFPEDGSSNTTITRGFDSNEDVAIGWTGDLFVFTSGATSTETSIKRYART